MSLPNSGLAEAIEEVRDPERRHQQRDAFLVDEAPAAPAARSTRRARSSPPARATKAIDVGEQLVLDTDPAAAPSCAKRAIASAANSTIAPCAKLNTPDALKMSTKPSAISE